VSPESLFAWKLRLLGAGSIFLVLGIALDRNALVIAAIAVLGVAFLLRFLDPTRGPPPRHPSWDDEDDEGPGR
jgi:hypothetical protein